MSVLASLIWGTVAIVLFGASLWECITWYKAKSIRTEWQKRNMRK